MTASCILSIASAFSRGDGGAVGAALGMPCSSVAATATLAAPSAFLQAARVPATAAATALSRRKRRRLASLSSGNSSAAGFLLSNIVVFSRRKLVCENDDFALEIPSGKRRGFFSKITDVLSEKTRRPGLAYAGWLGGVP